MCKAQQVYGYMGPRAHIMATGMSTQVALHLTLCLGKVLARICCVFVRNDTCASVRYLCVVLCGAVAKQC